MNLALVLTLATALTCRAQDLLFLNQIDEFLKNCNFATEREVETRVQRGCTDCSTELSPSTTPSSRTDGLTALSDKWHLHVAKVLSQGVTKFTLDMDRAIQNTTLSKDENLLFSPVSLSLTLAMVMLASAGKTFDDLSRMIGLETGIDIQNHSEAVHQVMGLAYKEFQRRQKLDNNTAPQTNIAFCIFIKDGFPIREEFRSMSEKVYQSDVTHVNFSSNAEKTKKIINSWVADKTMGKITHMLKQPPSPATEVLIVSTLYFKGEWDQHFLVEATRRKKFFVSENETIYVDLMINAGDFPYHEDKDLGLKIIGFPYKGNQATMYAMMPTRGKGAAALDKMKSRLTPDVIDSLIAQTRNIPCTIVFPKMQLSNNVKLRSAFEALGLKSLFDPSTADLSILSPGRRGKAEAQPAESTTASQPTEKNRMKHENRPINQEFLDYLESQNLTNFGVDDLRKAGNLNNPGLYADDVVHQVVMTVDEKGTEAAATTFVTLDRSNSAKRFVANRPFLFFIRHEVSKVILFWGSINRPTPAYESP